MASKRTASSDLNHTNWNEEDDPEEAGSFSKACEDVIKNRVIKVPKRRNPIGSLAATEGEKKLGAFASFGGFTRTPSSTATTTTSSPFSFLTNITNKSTEEQPKTNGLSNTSSIIKTSSAGTSNSIFQSPPSKPLTSITTAITSQLKNSKDYYTKLKGLNESVAKWVNQHVNANPFINLTPVFRDYEKYINELDSSREAEKEKSSTQVALNAKDFKSFTTTTSSKTETQKEVSTFTFKPSKENKAENRTSIYKNTKTTTVVEVDEEPDKQSTPKFNFGTSTPTTSSFAFAKTSLQSSPTFSFGGDSSKPFTFSNVTSASTEEKKEENDEEEEPQKVAFTPVVEEGHIYTARSKLLVGKNWVI